MSENTFTHNSINVNPLHKITIVAARWNAELVDDLVHAASEHLTKIGYKNIETIYVPGSWELVHASQKALEKSDGVISFGVVIRGETTHYELVTTETFRSIGNLAMDYPQISVINNVICVENENQLKERLFNTENNTKSLIKLIHEKSS